MKESISDKLKKQKSIYIPVNSIGDIVIRVSNHFPVAERLVKERVTRKCKNIYLIFVKNMVDKSRKNGVKLANLIRLTESTDDELRIQGEVDLNNFIVKIGNDIQKGMNYKIIDGNSEYELKKAINDVKNMLKSSNFIPLKHIVYPQKT
jgi:hypothetical protein